MKKPPQKCFIKFLKKNSLDAEIQDRSTSISIESRILKKMHELTEMSYGAGGDESDKHI